MATKITLYIGAENQTHQITKEYEEKIQTTLRKYWDNFTLTKSKGCYKGVIEDSITAVIIVLQLVFKELEDCIGELKVKLEQDTIAFEITANVDFKVK
ncbi:hypothetical protein HY484_04035 [Candidatus Woesearchaeota archaeon]|nr:hypothetical protein [Candidatus Woesearchaeota archaeon]